jgi:hypothetical protein
MGSGGMIARRGVMGLLVGGLAALLGGCRLLGGSSYRFRMTVEVESPQGVRAGSAVYEVAAHKSVALTSEERKGGGGLRGEAVIVDLPDGPLFVTLKMPVAGEDLGEAATFALAPDTKRGKVDAYVAAVGELGGMSGGAKAELPRKDWPMMVRFADVNDPKSVEQVDPALAGVKRILVETTRDDVTTGVAKRLPWLRALNGGYLNGAATARNAGLGLAAGDFSTEIFHAQ